MKVWAGPLAISAITLAGLVAALLLDGPLGDGAGAVGLGVPTLALAWFLRPARRNRPDARLRSCSRSAAGSDPS